MVLDEGDNCMATIFMEDKGVFKLADLSKVQTNIPFDPSDYDETQVNVNVALKHIKELLNVPSQFI